MIYSVILNLKPTFDPGSRIEKIEEKRQSKEIRPMGSPLEEESSLRSTLRLRTLLENLISTNRATL
jgi:hypothetical protein